MEERRSPRPAAKPLRRRAGRLAFLCSLGRRANLRRTPSTRWSATALPGVRRKVAKAGEILHGVTEIQGFRPAGGGTRRIPVTRAADGNRIPPRPASSRSSARMPPHRIGSPAIPTEPFTVCQTTWESHSTLSDPAEARQPAEGVEHLREGPKRRVLPSDHGGRSRSRSAAWRSSRKPAATSAA